MEVLMKKGRVLWGLLIILAMLALAALIGVSAAGAKAGQVEWQFDEQPGIQEVDGYWVVPSDVPGKENRCYDEPQVVQLWDGWVVQCSSGNAVRVGSADAAELAEYPAPPDPGDLFADFEWCDQVWWWPDWAGCQQ